MGSSPAWRMEIMGSPGNLCYGAGAWCFPPSAPTRQHVAWIQRVTYGGGRPPATPCPARFLRTSGIHVAPGRNATLGNSRIPFARSIAALALLTTACLDTVGPVSPRLPTSAAVQDENLRTGTAAWAAGLDAGPESIIGGYGLPASLASGDTLRLFVAAQSSRVSISIYRLGWYGGAGARLLARHGDRTAPPQPACSPPVPGPSVCPWLETDHFVVDQSWVPGLYVAKFADSLGRSRAFPFVVRSNRPTAFVVVLPFATYQAYNDWGGASLYGGPGATPSEVYANRAVKVSSARPLSASVMTGMLLGLDYLLVRWLEQNAYDVSYITDYDFHRGGGDPAIAWLFSGHSEYWSWPMWLRAKAARAQGISLGFLGGNDIYWLVRYETAAVNGLEAPVVVCYRDATQDPLGDTPGLATVRFRSSPNNTPENELVGVMSVPGKLQVRNSPVDLVVANGSDPLMAGTDLTTGEHIPRAAGWEGDRIVENGATPPSIRILFASPYVLAEDATATQLMQATVYRWPASGALVYASGQPGFTWSLASFDRHIARPPIQRFLQNVLRAFVEARANR